MFCNTHYGQKKMTNEDKEDIIEKTHSRIMSSIEDSVSEKISEILINDIDGIICEKIKKLWNAGLLNDFISSSKGKKGKEEKETEETKSILTNKEKNDPISYNEALSRLGGEEAIISHKIISDKIQLSMKDTIVCREIDRILPPPINRLARSIRHINQPYVSNIDELYEKAERALPEFEKQTKKFATLTKSQIIVAALKSRERAADKASFKYKDFNNKIGYFRLNDIVRGTLIYESIPDLYNGLEKSANYFDVKELNDRYQNPFDEGYRDIQLVVEINGFMCELQLTTSIMLRAKNTSGHRSYEVSRQMVAGVKDQKYDQVANAMKFGEGQLGSNTKYSLFDDQSCRLLAHEAAKFGDANILDLLLKSGADVNTQDDDGNTPLHHAISNGHESCVWLLINKYECKLNRKNHGGETPLVLGYVMLYKGELSEAATRAVITLLQVVNKEELDEAIEFKDTFITKRLRNNRSLVSEAADGNVMNMKRLLQSFADPNSDDGKGTTALQMAVLHGHREVVDLLLGYRVSLDTKERKKNMVQIALDNNHIEIAQLLRREGADCKGTTWEALVEHTAAGDLVKMEDLLKAGVNANVWKGGTSALELSIRQGNFDAFYLLLKYNAIPDDVKDKIPMIEVANELGYKKMVQELLSAGASCSNVAPVQYEIPFDISKGVPGAFLGIARYGNKLFLCPHNVPHILVIDGDSDNVYNIPLKQKVEKVRNGWHGIVQYGTKLYCAPCDASSVLVIDGETEEIHTIPCPVQGKQKWGGIAAYGSKLFCAPKSASCVLIIDAKTEELRTIPCNVVGENKWQGIALYGSKMFCCPFEASSVLVIDCEAESTYTVPLEKASGQWKWTGIACYGNQLYCAPLTASSVLVINGDTEKTNLIPCGTDGRSGGQHGITRFDTKLVCAPNGGSTVLIIDGVTGKVTSRPCINESTSGQWSDIVQYGTKVFCSPFHSDSVLVLQDQALQLTLDAMKHCESNKKEKQLVKSSFLVDYTRYGNTQKMEELLVQGVDPNSVKDGITALQMAIQENHIDAVELLLRYDASTENTVKEAMDLGFTDIVKVLSKGGVSYGPLVTCARDGNVEEMRKMLSIPVNPSSLQDGVSALQAAVRGSHQEAVELLLQYNASIADGDDGVPILRDALDFERDIGIAQMLVDAGARCENVTLLSRLIPLGGEDDERKWGGIAEYNGKVICVPFNSSSVLIVDCVTEEIRMIPTNIDGDRKWFGIAQCGTKLYCAPFNASSVLVIDGDTEEIHFIPCTAYKGKSNRKWWGIAKCGTKLFCSPSNASSILVIDATTEELRFIPCGVEGDHKWGDIALYGSSLYCAPCNASSLLVIDGKSEEIHTIPCKVEGDAKWKWFSITSYKNKLYCIPHDASSVLVVDGDTEETSTIPCGVDGNAKWNGAAKFGSKLVCAPQCAKLTLVIDGETNEVMTRPCGDDSTIGKWNGIAHSGTKLFCSPLESNTILVLEDAQNRISQLNVTEVE